MTKRSKKDAGYICGHCKQPINTLDGLRQHAKDRHRGVRVYAYKRDIIVQEHEAADSESIADQVIDAKLRAAMGCPEDYDEFILEGFE